MDLLTSEFKERSVRLIDECIVKLQQYKGNLPINLGLIQMGKNMFITPIEGDCLIKMFIEDSVDSWDAIKNRDEDALIATFKGEVQDRAPLMQDMFGRIIDFLLKNRRELFEEEFEEYLWDETGELIKIAIRFAHLKREPKVNTDGVMKYTRRYEPSLRIKKQAEQWGVDL